MAFLILVAVTAGIFAAGKKEAGTAEAAGLIVFNAASTTDLVNDLGALFYKQTGIIIKSNPASSGTLARQLEQGARAGIFISASKEWMEYVQNLGLSRQSDCFLRNNLVLIAPAKAGRDFIEITQNTHLPDLFSGRISIGDPAHVPAGQYAVQALKYFGWLDNLSLRLQPAADVRAALLVVEMGETELGIVYETDAIRSGKVSIAGRFPEDSHDPVLYYCSVLADPSPAALSFHDFLLKSRKAAAIYVKYGFSPYK